MAAGRWRLLWPPPLIASDCLPHQECMEEASLPRDVLERLVPTGLVSYRYATRKGLSTKHLAIFDLEMPKGMLPMCGDGEVEEFRLLPIDEVIAIECTRIATGCH